MRKLPWLWVTPIMPHEAHYASRNHGGQQHQCYEASVISGGDAYSGKRRPKKEKGAYFGARIRNLGTKPKKNKKLRNESKDMNSKRFRAIPEGPALRVCDHGRGGWQVYRRYAGAAGALVGHPLPSHHRRTRNTFRTKTPAIYRGREP